MIIYFRFSCFLFKIKILLIKINKQQVISFFLDRYWLRYGLSKRVKYKNPKKVFSKIIWKFGFWVFILFFFKKSTYNDVKSVEEYNFNLFWYNIYAYSQKKIILNNFRSMIDLWSRSKKRSIKVMVWSRSRSWSISHL